MTQTKTIMTDIYIKDEGDFLTICFQTPEAIKALRDQPIEVLEHLYGSDGYKKLDIDSSQVNMIVGFAISYNLSFDSEITITTPKKESWFDREKKSKKKML